MRKAINTVELEGRIYEHSLEKKLTGEKSNNPGTEYIRGEIKIATKDSDNIIPVRYTYVTEKTAKGKKNANWYTLSKIIENGKTIINDGLDDATLITIFSSIGVNDFYGEDAETKELVLRSPKIVDGGLVKIVSKLPERTEKTADRANKFTVDMFINKITEVEANEEKGYPAYAKIAGYIFNYKGDIFPVEFVAKKEKAVDYFVGMAEELPVFTKVWGVLDFTNRVSTMVTQNAFGEDEVEERAFSQKTWEITGANIENYELGDETIGVTEEEMKKKSQDREVMLAERKAAREEYLAQNSNNAIETSTKTETKTVKNQKFNF